MRNANKIINIIIAFLVTATIYLLANLFKLIRRSTLSNKISYVARNIVLQEILAKESMDQVDDEVLDKAKLRITDYLEKCDLMQYISQLSIFKVKAERKIFIRYIYKNYMREIVITQNLDSLSKGGNA